MCIAFCLQKTENNLKFFCCAGPVFHNAESVVKLIGNLLDQKVCFTSVIIIRWYWQKKKNHRNQTRDPDPPLVLAVEEAVLRSEGIAGNEAGGGSWAGGQRPSHQTDVPRWWRDQREYIERCSFASKSRCGTGLGVWKHWPEPKQNSRREIFRF